MQPDSPSALARAKYWFNRCRPDVPVPADDPEHFYVDFDGQSARFVDFVNAYAERLRTPTTASLAELAETSRALWTTTRVLGCSLGPFGLPDVQGMRNGDCEDALPQAEEGKTPEKEADFWTRLAGDAGYDPVWFSSPNGNTPKRPAKERDKRRVQGLNWDAWFSGAPP